MRCSAWLLLPRKGAKDCDEYNGLSICPLAYLENQIAELPHIFVIVACGRGSVLVCRRCDTLCTSGFVDDVNFSHGLYCA